MELYSWQEPAAFYNMILDTDAIGRDRKQPHSTCRNRPSISVFARAGGLLHPPDRLSEGSQRATSACVSRIGACTSSGRTGTIVYMPECDRLTICPYRKLVEHAVKEMARVYRRQIATWAHALHQ